MALNLLGELLQHVDLARAAHALLETLHDLVGPLGALTARSALAAGLVAVEVTETRDGAHNVGALVHDDDGSSAETGLAVLEGIEVHELVVADMLGQNRGRRTAGNDGQQVVPAATDATAMLLDQLAHGNAHLLLNSARVVHVAADTKELSAVVALAAEAGEPGATTAADGRGDRDGLDVGDGRRTAEQTNGSRERGLKTGLAGLALKRLDQAGLLATDVGTSTAVDVDVEVVARAAGVLADQALGIGLVDGVLQDGSLLVELATDVDVGGSGVHGAAGNEAALDQLVGVLAHNLAVLAGARLTLVGVDDQIARLVVLVPVFEVHEGLCLLALRNLT